MFFAHVGRSVLDCSIQFLSEFWHLGEVGVLFRLFAEFARCGGDRETVTWELVGVARRGATGLGSGRGRI